MLLICPIIAYESQQCNNTWRERDRQILVFIGYSSLHKGYRCFEPQTNHVYIFKHPIFDKHEFLFATHIVYIVQDQVILLFSLMLVISLM